MAAKRKTALKPASREVTVFACGHCGKRFDKRADADEHCVCACGRLVKIERDSWRTEKKCALCQTREHVMEAHRRVKRDKDDLASSEEHLAKLQGELEALKAKEAS